MSYTLGGITLPQPKSFTRNFVEKSAINTNIDGKSAFRVENRKEEFTLVYQNLTQSQVDNILSEYNLNAVRTFTSTEANLAIPATDVLIDIGNREFAKGPYYRENLTLILTEVE